MAKGIRSKSMRRSRSLLRAAVMEPIQEKRQLEISAALKKKLIEKANDGSIVNLKHKLSANSKGADSVHEVRAMEIVGADDINNKEIEVKSTDYSNITGLRLKKKKLSKHKL